MTKWCKAAVLGTSAEDAPPMQHEVLTQIADLKKFTTDATEQINQELAFCMDSLAALKIRSEGDGAEDRQLPVKPLGGEQENQDPQRKPQETGNSFKVYDFNIPRQEQRKGNAFNSYEMSLLAEEPDEEPMEQTQGAKQTALAENTEPGTILKEAVSNDAATVKKFNTRKALQEKNKNLIARSPPGHFVAEQNKPGLKRKIDPSQLRKTRLSVGAPPAVCSPNSPNKKQTTTNGEVLKRKEVRRVKFNENIQYKVISPLWDKSYKPRASRARDDSDLDWAFEL